MKNILFPSLFTSFAALLANTSTVEVGQRVEPDREGHVRARVREAQREAELADLYAETPSHPETRQQRRAAERASFMPTSMEKADLLSMVRAEGRSRHLAHKAGA